MQRFVYALDLHDDLKLIAEYEAWHRPGKVWPAIVESLRAEGVIDVQIFRTGSRMFLILDATDEFSAEAKEQADRANPDVQAWERLMWQYQKALPWAREGQKWVPMDRIFSLQDMPRTDP